MKTLISAAVFAVACGGAQASLVAYPSGGTMQISNALSGTVIEDGYREFDLNGDGLIDLGISAFTTMTRDGPVPSASAWGETSLPVSATEERAASDGEGGESGNVPRAGSRTQIAVRDDLADLLWLGGVVDGSLAFGSDGELYGPYGGDLGAAEGDGGWQYLGFRIETGLMAISEGDEPTPFFVGETSVFYGWLGLSRGSVILGSLGVQRQAGAAAPIELSVVPVPASGLLLGTIMVGGALAARRRHRRD